MKIRHAAVAALFVVFAVPATSRAGLVGTGTADAPFTLEAGPVSGFPPLGGTPSIIGAGDLADLHGQLHASGITTDGFVTILLGDTGAGSAVFALVDDEAAGGTPMGVTELSMTTTAPVTATHWLNDGGEIMSLSGPVGDIVSAAVTFQWLDTRGDAWAWTGLQPGDEITFDFDLISGVALPGPEPLQFITWSEDRWKVAGTSGFPSGQPISMQINAVPAPPALAALLAGLAFGRRRRRKN